jgi:hypothetical protein
MGLFDTVHCKKALPADAPEFLKKSPFFQTYDLGRGMGEYTITEDGVLQVESNMMSWILEEALKVDHKPLAIPLTYRRKRIEMYASNLRGGAPRGGKYVYFTDDGSDYISVTYVVQIRNGKVSSIKEKSRSAQPARPYSEMNGEPDASGPAETEVR